MIPSISRGRGRRAPRVIRSTVVYLLLATVGCQSGAPSPVVTSANEEPGKAGLTAERGTVEQAPEADRKEGGTGTRAKGEEGANKRYAVAGPEGRREVGTGSSSRGGGSGSVERGRARCRRFRHGRWCLALGSGQGFGNATRSTRRGRGEGEARATSFSAPRRRRLRALAGRGA